MKIASPFRDYYDVALANDRDCTPLYLRQPAEYPSKERSTTANAVTPFPSQPHLPGENSYYRRSQGCVAFCGRQYPFWIVEGVICYTLSQIVAAINKKIESFKDSPGYNGFAKPQREMLRALEGKKVNASTGFRSGWGALNAGTWEAWQEHMKVHGKMSDEVFIREKAPVIAVKGETVLVNPNLYLLNFHTVMDPYTAYQEISMFMGNNLAQQVDPIPKTTDELKAHAHGFDKWSFRTHKEDSRKAKKQRAKQTPPKKKTTKKEKPLKLDDSDFE